MPNTKHLLLNFLLFSRLVNAITIIILLIIIINYCNHYHYHYKQIKHPFSARNIFLWYFLEHIELNLAKKKLPSIQRNTVHNICFLWVKQMICIKILISLKSPLTNIERKYILSVYYHITSYPNNTMLHLFSVAGL